MNADVIDDSMLREINVEIDRLHKLVMDEIRNNPKVFSQAVHINKF